MFTYFNRLKNKSGFTLVELVVVVGIITIMSAIAVPNIISSQRRAEGIKQSNQARTFYFAVQQTLLDAMEYDNTPYEFSLDLGGGGRSFRISCNEPTPCIPPPQTPCPHSIASIVNTPATGEFFYLYITMGATGDIQSADLSRNAPSNPPFVTNDGTDTDFERLVAELVSYSEFASQEGFYYAMFDSELRVAAAYYSRFADNTTITDGVSVDSTQDNRVNGSTFGAFPRDYSWRDVSYSLKYPVFNKNNITKTPLKVRFKGVL